MPLLAPPPLSEILEPSLIAIVYMVLVEWLSEKIVHILIKAPNLVIHTISY